MSNQTVTVVLTTLSALIILFLFSGCAYYKDQLTNARLENGYTMVLPGIEGQDRFNSNVAQGLEDAGVPTAIEVYDWTTGRPWRFLNHLQNIERNRQEARVLADRIVAYQNQYPGRPVNLIGHSGGGGLILLTLDELPPDRTINSAILLAPAVSPRYDLTTALQKTDRGIWNCYSYGDIPLLVLGTSLAGTIDRRFTVASGAIGFKMPKNANEETLQQYHTKLHQIPFQFPMVFHGNLGGHFGWTTRTFSRKTLATIIRGD